MTRKRKGNRFDDIDGGAAFVLPLTLLRHENWTRLTPFGSRLILDLGAQYTGFNNGYLCASWSLMKDRGWRSSETLYKAMLECEHYGLIVRTQHGGLNKPNLHGFTWRRIDEKAGHVLEMRPTEKPCNAWKEPRVTFVYAPAKHVRKPASRRFKQAFEKHVA